MKRPLQHIACICAAVLIFFCTGCRRDRTDVLMREPSQVTLNKGWNHIRLVAPMPVKAARHYPWVAIFVPVTGPTDHPSEVEGLRFSSHKPE